MRPSREAAWTAGADGQATLEDEAQGVDHTGDLVHDGDRVGCEERRGKSFVAQVDVGETTASGLDLDKYLARSGQGNRCLFHHELPRVHVVAPDEHGVHGALLSVRGTCRWGRPTNAAWYLASGVREARGGTGTPQRLPASGLVWRYDPEASPDGLDGDEGTFSICSFWYVEALTRAGRLDEARLTFEKMLTYANHVGLYAEEISHTGEQLGNFPQAFTHLALNSAAFNLDRALG